MVRDGMVSPGAWTRTPPAQLSSLTYRVPSGQAGVLGAPIGPLFGILFAGYYLVSQQKVWVDDMYTINPSGRSWFRNGYNPNAVKAVAISGAVSIASVLIPKVLLDSGAITVDATWIGNNGHRSSQRWPGAFRSPLKPIIGSDNPERLTPPEVSSEGVDLQAAGTRPRVGVLGCGGMAGVDQPIDLPADGHGAGTTARPSQGPSVLREGARPCGACHLPKVQERS